MSANCPQWVRIDAPVAVLLRFKSKRATHAADNMAGLKVPATKMSLIACQNSTIGKFLFCAIGLVLSFVITPVPHAQTISPPAYTLPRFGEIKPSGWMLRQMQTDLTDGLAGHYTEISDTVNMRQFELQAADEPDSNGHPGWWYGEHEGYFADGFFRLAWLAGDASAKEAAIARLEDVLAAQDSTGYIGVYPAGKRFGEQDPNDGELWTQSRMYQALLAWYEATGETRILNAVEKAARLTLASFQNTGYFYRAAGPGGGVEHGVGFSDTLEWLYRLTGDDTYRNGYLWLYSDYASSNVQTSDMMPMNLIDVSRPWYAHTPHIAESLSMPAIASAYGGSSEYANAADQVLGKLVRHSNPGGGPVGDESVAGRSGSFELTSEYCSMTETIASLNRLAQYRDMMATADISERIALNIAQGARIHTAATAVSYLTADNRLSAMQTDALGDRLLYSASHQTAACCSLNSTRLLPYYVEGMWLKATDGSGLMARLYGPSTFDTAIAGTSISVVEETDFPFSDTVTFTLSPKVISTFTLSLRISAYSRNPTATAPAGMTIAQFADRFEISGAFNADSVVTLKLGFDVHRISDSNGESAFAYGPILYALPVDSVAIPGRVTRADGAVSTLVFQDTEYIAASDAPAYLIARDSSFKAVSLPAGDVIDPWTKPPTGLAGALLSPDGSHVNVTLVPLGSTLLRIAGFRVDEIFADPVGG